MTDRVAGAAGAGATLFAITVAHFNEIMGAIAVTLTVVLLTRQVIRHGVSDFVSWIRRKINETGNGHQDTKPKNKRP